jgi:hypothetical protein
LRGFDLAKKEQILRYSSERCLHTASGRLVFAGRIDDLLVLVPCESEQGSITPITIQATTRQQINLHLVISDEPEAGSVERGPNITFELNDRREMTGLEILEASQFIRDSIMDSVQAWVLRLPELQPARFSAST